MPKARFVEVTCTCGFQSSIRIDQFNRKQGMWICRACAQKLKFQQGMQKRKPKFGEGVKVDKKYRGAYASYSKAKQRCKINHHGAYLNIQFKFDSFEQFFKELGPRPEGMTLDRIDNKGHYEPGNVRWATQAEQNRNRNNNVLLEYQGQLMCMTDAAKASGISYGTLEKRVKAGCPMSHMFIKGRWRYRNGALANTPE